MPGCKDCRGGGVSLTRVDDALKLYAPGLRGLAVGGTSWGTSRCKGRGSCQSTMGKCGAEGSRKGGCGGGEIEEEGEFEGVGDIEGEGKGYYSKNYNTALIRQYEEQPWFRNPVVQKEWKGFVDQLVTPKNIGCRLHPGPEDWEFKCHGARALIGPTVPCVWNLPEQDNSGSQYGVNRDWRRYNEDQRKESCDIECGCNEEPRCKSGSEGKGQRSCEWPPYLGKRFGSRYMAWGNPSSGMFPRSRPFNYSSNPKC